MDSYHIIMMKQLISVMVMAFSTCSLAGFVSYFREYLAHPTNPVEGCADANPKTMLPNDT